MFYVASNLIAIEVFRGFLVADFLYQTINATVQTKRVSFEILAENFCFFFGNWPFFV